MRLGIFGGSFDPIHLGHLLLAENCREQCRLDRVWLLPAAISPHKRNRSPAPAKQRIEMIELAIGGHPHFAVSTLEIDRGGISYTVDTLAEIRRREPQADLFLLLGADSLHDLPNWRAAERICQLATPVVVRRPDAPQLDFSVLDGLVDAARQAEVAACQVDMPCVEISSTDIRRRVAAGRSVRYQTPRAVEKYIESHGLYVG